jgi:COP9 signalosome complex subunit 1
MMLTWQRAQKDVQLDLYLSAHAQTLLGDIRRKALVQYFTPFEALDIATMARAFNTSVAGMERELSLLIMDGQIQARIDSATKILHARQTDIRDAAFKATMQMGVDYEQVRRSLSVVLRGAHGHGAHRTPRRRSGAWTCCRTTFACGRRPR